MSKFQVNIPLPVISLEVVRDESPEVSFPEETETENPANDFQPEPENEEKIVLSPDEFEQEIQNAYHKGLSEGEIRGYQKCEQETRPLKQNLESSIQLLMNAKSEVEKSLEEFSVNLAFKIAQKILETELSLRPELIRERLQNIVHSMIEDSEITLYLHPDDQQFLQNQLDEIRSDSPKIRKIHLVPDTSIKKGGFLIETRGGILDSRLDSMLDEMKKNILQKLKAHES